MPLISVEIMKIIDERGTRKKKKNKDRKRTRGQGSCSERVRAKWLCCPIKLGFLQLIRKASSLICKASNL